MFIKRTGSSLSSCSKDFYYKVSASDKMTVTIIDNNGEECLVRKNSNKWDFSPVEPNTISDNIGSLEPKLQPVIIHNTVEHNSSNHNTTNNSSVSGSDLATGLIIGSLLL